MVIVCDSACDLWKNQIKDWNVRVINIPYSINGVECAEQPATAEEIDEFYSKVRKGAAVKTALINETVLEEYIENILKEGEDVLFISFSGELTATYKVMGKIIERLTKKYPKRKIRYVDTLQVTMASGLFVYQANKMRASGKSLDEIADYLEEIKQHICCFFGVEDLMHLRRGGRIGAATAIVGTALGIRPILICDKDGKLEKIGTVKGKKGVIAKLIDYMNTYGENVADFPIVVMHSVAPEDAEVLRREVVKIVGTDANVWVQPIGTIIGTHCGPGTLALVFWGKHR